MQIQRESEGREVSMNDKANREKCIQLVNLDFVSIPLKFSVGVNYIKTKKVLKHLCQQYKH